MLNYAIPQYLKIIRKVSEKQKEWGVQSALGIACQKSLDKMNKYFNESLTYPCSSVATICDPRFNVNVFNLVMESSQDDNAKKAKIRSHFKTCFYQYQDREIAVKRARFLKEQQDALETLEDKEEEDESDAELYQKGPIELDPETEFTIYLIQLVLPRETNIYQYQKAKQFKYPIVSRIARDYLAIPATSAPSERVFSSGGDIVTQKRNRLTRNSVRMIVCLKAWGIIQDEDLVEEEEED